MQLLLTAAAHCVTRATFHMCPSITRKASCQTRLDTMHVRVHTNDAGPVHGLQRSASCPAVAGAKFLETVAATRMHHIRELVHAIAGLQVRWRSTQHTRAPNTACKRQWIRLPASAPPHPATAHGRKKQATIAAKGGLPQPARTAQSPSPLPQMVTMHLSGHAHHIHIGKSSSSYAGNTGRNATAPHKDYTSYRYPDS